MARGKESVELDIKGTAGAGWLDALLERADVFIHNISPGAAVRLGLDSGALGRSFPDLIARRYPARRSGPLASSKAYDLLVQGERACCRSRRRGPVTPGSASRSLTSRPEMYLRQQSSPPSTTVTDRAGAGRERSPCSTASRSG